MSLECYKKDLDNLIQVSSILEKIEKGPKLFIFTENGIIHSQMYNGGAYMINFAINKSEFFSYKFTTNTPFLVDISDFNKILKKVTDGEKVFIEKKPETLEINCFSQAITKKYIIKLQEIEDEDITSQFEMIKKASTLPFEINLRFHPEGIKELFESIVNTSKQNFWITFGINLDDGLLFLRTEEEQAEIKSLIEVKLEEYTKFDRFENEISESLNSETTIDIRIIYDILSLDKAGENSSLKMSYSNNAPIRIMIRNETLKFGFLAAPVDLDDDDDDLDELDE